MNVEWLMRGKGNHRVVVGTKEGGNGPYIPLLAGMSLALLRYQGRVNEWGESHEMKVSTKPMVTSHSAP